MLMLPAHIPTKTYAQLRKEIAERAKNYPNPQLFRGLNLSKKLFSTNDDNGGLIDVNESDHGHYMRVIGRLRKAKGY